LHQHKIFPPYNLSQLDNSSSFFIYPFKNSYSIFMARSFKSLSPMINVLLLLLVVSSSFFISDARPLSVAGAAHGSMNKGFELFFFDGLYIEGIKSGPSHGGIGNKYTNAQTLGAVINSGPSNGGPGNWVNNVTAMHQCLLHAIYLFILQDICYLF